MTDQHSDFFSFHPLTDTSFNLFFNTNALLTILAAAGFLYVYMRKRHLCLRPSLLIAGFFHVFLQWPLVAFSTYYERWLPTPWDLAIALHSAVLLPLIWAFALPDTRLKTCWNQMAVETSPLMDNQRIVNTGLLTLACLSILTMGIYFSYMPADCSGLYGYVFYPEIGLLLREFSLKLLDSRTAAYAYSFYTSFVSGLLFLFLYAKLRYLFTQRRYGLGLLCIAVMPLIIVTGCLEGSSYRFFTYGILLTLFLVWNSKLALKLKDLAVIIVIFACLFVVQMRISLAVGIELDYARSTILQAKIDDCTARIPLKPIAKNIAWQREIMSGITFTDKAPTPQEITELKALMASQANIAPATPEAPVEEIVQKKNLLERVFTQLPAIANRIWVVPFQVGSWHYHYAQTKGAIGIAGIPRLAKLMGVQPVSVGQAIGLTYGPGYYGGRGVTETINASSGLIFTFYAFFGRLGIGLILLMLAFMDLFLLLILRLSPPARAIFMSFITISCLNMMQSDFGYILFSGGLLPGASIMVFVQGLEYMRQKYRSQ